MDNAFNVLTLSVTDECESLWHAGQSGNLDAGMNAAPLSRSLSNLIVGGVFVLGVLVVGLVAFLA
jgi:hypothetical protein